MKIKLLTLAAVLLFASFTLGSTQPTRQWEYKFEYKCDEKKANVYASDGWELVTVSEAGNLSNLHCVFKRPKS